jgi:CheY-like chemotaxis protein
MFGSAAHDPSEAKWQVHYADQGETAIELVKQGLENHDPFTAVFLDIRMPPGLDGYDTAEEIRKLDPGVHIVVVSGYSDFTEQDLLEVAGPRNRFTMMPKPVWPADLQKLASRLCDPDYAGT